jgi:HD superfamily phosphohydrolase
MAKSKTDQASIVQPDPNRSLSLTTPDESAPTNAGAEVPEIPKSAARVQGLIAPRRTPGRKLYQDEVYGTKELTPLAVAVIDTPEFQRLGYIYQLGFTHTVFRGATHRRFDHSVGTYFVVRTLLRRIVQNHTRFYRGDPEQFCHPGLWLSPRLFVEAPATPGTWQSLYSPMGRWRGLVEVVSAAALLHDLGHVPVGHTMEDEFSLFRKHDSLGGPRLFEMLYGPRTPIQTGPSSNASPIIDDYFTPIDQGKLPKPDLWERVPLPWVFEDGTYDRFFPDVIQGEVPALSNREIRDLIYLTLSFKETVDGQTGHVVYTDFERELSAAEEEAKGDLTSSQRIAFIRALHNFYSRPIPVGPDHEERPLFHPFMSDVVGNTICADLLDYLVRDGKRLKLDIRDNPRLQRYLVVRPASSFVVPDQDVRDTPRRRLTINAVHRNGLKRRDTVSDLMDLMGERYRFAEIVYYHPKKAAFSAMVAKAIEILTSVSSSVRDLDAGSIYPAPWIQTGGLPPEARHACHFGDESLLAFLSKEAEKTDSASAASLVRSILSRSEYRLAFTLDYEAAQDAGGPRKFIDYLRQGQDAGRKSMEAVLNALVARSTIQEEVPVLLYCPNIRMQAKEVAAHVELTPNKVMPLSLEGEDPQVAEEIRVLNGKYQRLWRLYLFAHPKLVLGEQSPERTALLSAIVDTFCMRFGVPDRARVRGARFDFIPFEKRAGDHFRKWLEESPLKFQLDPSVDARLRGLTEDRSLWTSVLTPEAPFPVSFEEYSAGFARAIVIAAADDASKRHREQWPENLRSMQGAQWYTSSYIPNVETARDRGMASLAKLAESVRTGAPASARAKNWEQFVDFVALALSPKA